ncbi:MAG: class I SAM-dependent methyltransferase [Candidatus Bathyarchaeia archaeon]|jgi:SAM-dependent methyltransferase
MTSLSVSKPGILGRNPKLNAIMLDFNQQLRFHYIPENLRKLCSDQLRLLDVGAGVGTLNNYLINQISGDITNVETTNAYKLSNQVIADGRHLPFADSAFDVTLSSDVLEHIDAADRAAFLQELQRCARIGVVFTFSTIHKQNPKRSGIRLFEKLSRNQPQWYLEHNSTAIIRIENLAESLGLDLEPTVGVLALFFTGLLQNVPWRANLRATLNVISYLIVRAIDMPPYYGYGVTIIKKGGKGFEKNGC